MAMGRDLTACYWTLAGARPGEGNGTSALPLILRARAATAVGYSGLGLDHADLMANLRVHKASGMRAMLEDAGIRFVELEGLIGWDHADPDGAARVYDDMLEASADLPVRHIKATAGFSGEMPAIDAMAAGWRRLALRGGRSTPRLGLEIVAFSHVRSLETALQVIAAAPDTGIVLDSWHFARGMLPLAPLRTIAPDQIVAVEINNVADAVCGTLLEDTLDHRRLCDDGMYDVGAFLESALASGYTGPIGVEILSTQLRALSVEAAADASIRGVVDLVAYAENINDKKGDVA